MISCFKIKKFLKFLRQELLMKRKTAIFIFLFILTVATGTLSFNFALAEEKIDINFASWEDLQKITGIGPVIAERIIDARPFSSVNELIKVNGIGKETLEKIISQELAWVSVQSRQQKEFQEFQSQKIVPEITLSYPENNPANDEIKVLFSVSNLKNAIYDVKIAIEKEKIISSVYNENQNKWQSSHYYINDLFSGSSFQGTLRLKIKEEEINLQGEADIILRIRVKGENNYLEHKDKINISFPWQTKIKNTAAVSRTVSELPVSLNIVSIALVISFFSGIMVLILKKGCKKPKIC